MEDQSIKVVCRIRPSKFSETYTDDEDPKEKFIRQSENKRTCIINSPFARPYTFDYVAGEDSSQQEIFEEVGRPSIKACVAGYNGTVMCYGQTSTGKTHTIFGPNIIFDENPGNLEKVKEQRGLVPRVLEYLWKHMGSSIQDVDGNETSYSCKCSFYEIYQEKVFDMLSRFDDKSKGGLQIREDAKLGVYIQGLAEEEVRTHDDATKLLMNGYENRHKGETSMNLDSSRSHAVFQLSITTTIQRANSSSRTTRTSKFNMIDLAGSERQKDTGATGERLREAAQINKSLTVLGHVIKMLGAKGKSHVNFRDSKLTFLLRDSLGGNSKTVLVVTVSPDEDQGPESISTLTFAQRAKLIKTSAVVNEHVNATVGSLRREISVLKAQLNAVNSNNAPAAVSSSISPSGDLRKRMSTITLTPKGSANDVLRGVLKGEGVDSAKKEVTLSVQLDEKNRITFDEFKSMLPLLGYNVSSVIAQRLFNLLDRDGAGDLDIEEFKQTFTKDQTEAGGETEPSTSGSAGHSSTSSVDGPATGVGESVTVKELEANLKVDVLGDLAIVLLKYQKQVQEIEAYLQSEASQKDAEYRKSWERELARYRSQVQELTTYMGTLRGLDDTHKEAWIHAHIYQLQHATSGVRHLRNRTAITGELHLAQVMSLQSQLTETEKKLDEVIEIAESGMDASKRKLVESEQTVADLKTKLQAMNVLLIQAQAEAKSTKSSLTAARAAIAQLEENVSTLRNMTQQPAGNDASSAPGEIARLEKTVTELRTTLDLTREELETTKSEKESYLAAYNTAATTITDLDSAFIKLAEEKESLAAKILDQYQEIKRLQEEADRNAVENEDAAAAANRVISSLQGKYDMEVLDKNMALDNLEVLEQQLKGTQRDLKRVEAELQKYVESTEQRLSSSENASSSDGLSTAKSQVSANDNLKTLRSQLNNLQQDLQESIDYVAAESQESATQIDTLSVVSAEAIAPHHPGRFVKLKGVLYSSKYWECCKKNDASAIGCQSGPIRHHPTAGTCTFDQWHRWYCCSSPHRYEKGCRPGPHPSAFSDTVGGKIGRVHKGDSKQPQKPQPDSTNHNPSYSWLGAEVEADEADDKSVVSARPSHQSRASNSPASHARSYQTLSLRNVNQSISDATDAERVLMAAFSRHKSTLPPPSSPSPSKGKLNTLF